MRQVKYTPETIFGSATIFDQQHLAISADIEAQVPIYASASTI